MTLLPGEVCFQEGVGQFGGERGPYHAGTENEHVHIVMLDALVGRVDIVADPGANPFNFVRCNGCTDAAAADQDASLGLSIVYGVADGTGVVGIIIGSGRIEGAEVDNLVPRFELFGERGFHVVTSVVGGESETHAVRVAEARSRSGGEHC